MSVGSAIVKGVVYVGKVILKAAGFVGAAGEVIGAGRQLADAARRGKLAHPTDDTDPIPLSPRQVTRQPTVVPLRRGQKK